MLETLKTLFSVGSFMPHGHCYFWDPGVLWMQVITNSLIAAAYIAISSTLAYMVYRIRDIPFRVIYLAFGAFIIACGMTHIMDVYVIWTPIYWTDSMVRAITAMASVGTALALPPLIPKAIALARGAQAAQQRGIALETMVADLGTMYEKTKELEQLKSQFFANVSHELRTPLTLILGPAEKMLQSANLPDQQRQDLDIILRNARLLMKHVTDLLEVSKLEAGRATIDYRTTDVGQLLRLTAANFEHLAAQQRVTVVMDIADKLTAELDPDKLQRIFMNLMSNAFKFAPIGGRVRCTAKKDARSGLRIEVADNGPGVHPDQREIIFERFRQGSDYATSSLGLGLGLAIAKELTVLHGGRIEVGDAPEGGALFVVQLPLSAQRDAQVQISAADPALMDDDVDANFRIVAQSHPGMPLDLDAIGVAPNQDAPVALVVEDHGDMVRFLVDILTPKYRVEIARDGEQGLKKAIALEPDVIISDVMMPKMDGEALVRHIRTHPALDTTPIVMLTAKDDNEVKMRLLRQGAQDYVAKPFFKDEVLVRVNKLVTIKRARASLIGELDDRTRDLETLAVEVQQHRRELQTALASLQVAKDLAEAASAHKTDFLGMVSHELRTPIGVLHMQLERLQRDPAEPVTPRQREQLHRMRATIKRLQDLVESLLQCARIQSGRLDLQIEAFNPREVARTVLDEVREQAEQKGLVLNFSDGGPASEDEPFRSDPALVRMIISNLVGNAVKFTQEGSVSLSVTRQDAVLQIEVCDTGPGIQVEDRTRLFEPFVQLEKTRKKHIPGVGLGLALVKQLSESLSGEVRLMSPGSAKCGTTFIVTLPKLEHNDADTDRRGRQESTH